MKLDIHRFYKGFALSLALFLSLSISSFAVEADMELAATLDGGALFNANCASCHAPCEGKVVTGPSLYGATNRWENRELLYTWVQNPKKAKATGDAYVAKLWDEWVPRAGVMTAQAVSPEEIEAILMWVEGAGQETCVTGPRIDGPGDETGAAVEEEGNLPTVVTILIIMLVVVFSAAGVRRMLKNATIEEEGGEPAETVSYFDELKALMANNKKTVSIIVILLIAFGAKDTWDTLADIGVYGGYEDRAENYRPEQPIDFSHKIHAGMNEINCEYCHSSASKSKHSGIPSANVCMNCHKYIQEGKRPNSKEEIAKIYDAIGWDVDAFAYTGEEKPIKWVKVHNLPDHVYFNHSQHVVVGGIECQECHGPIETMDVVEQYSKLTMGWCIDCHNRTEVKMDGVAKEYYDEMHERLSVDELRKFLEDGKITAKEMGGWECAKCHY